MQRHGDGRVYSQSSLDRCRGMKVKLVTTAAITSLLSVGVPQGSLNHRNPGVDAVSLVVRASTRGAARTGTRARSLLRAWNMRVLTTAGESTLCDAGITPGLPLGVPRRSAPGCAACCARGTRASSRY